MLRTRTDQCRIDFRNDSLASVSSREISATGLPPYQLKQYRE